MPNYGIQTRFNQVYKLKMKTNQRKIITTDRTALFISKPVKCQQPRENKEETIRDNGREEKR